MSHDLANSMRDQIITEIRRQGLNPRTMAERMGAVQVLFGDADMLLSTAMAMARSLGCRWEARLHQRETAGEAVALVRDAP